MKRIIEIMLVIMVLAFVSTNIKAQEKCCDECAKIEQERMEYVINQWIEKNTITEKYVKKNVVFSISPYGQQEKCSAVFLKDGIMTAWDETCIGTEVAKLGKKANGMKITSEFPNKTKKMISILEYKEFAGTVVAMLKPVNYEYPKGNVLSLDKDSSFLNALPYGADKGRSIVPIVSTMSYSKYSGLIKITPDEDYNPFSTYFGYGENQITVSYVTYDMQVYCSQTIEDKGSILTYGNKVIAIFESKKTEEVDAWQSGCIQTYSALIDLGID